MDAPCPNTSWQDFLAGPLYPPGQEPWRDDTAFAVITEEEGLRDSLGGSLTPVIAMVHGLVQALTGIDVLALGRARPPVLGVCLGFGMNALEPYELLQAFRLDCVHAYEWIAAQVSEAAQMFQTLRSTAPDLPVHLRLHHQSFDDLRSLSDASVQVVYTANVFTWEVPMLPSTFCRAVQEILRVLAADGVVISRGSSGVLESHLAPHGRMLLSTPLVTVFQKGIPLC